MNLVRNAILKGTFVGAYCMVIFGALFVDVSPLQGGVICLVSAAYVFIFMKVNAGRWEGVM